MTWNWQQPDWRHFSWDKFRLRKAEEHFLVGAGVFAGTLRHLPQSDREQLTIEAISTEAVTTSEIEGEILNRESVQSSIRRQFGLAVDSRRVAPAEEGISEMMVNLYRSFAEPLSDAMLFTWHRMLFERRGISTSAVIEQATNQWKSSPVPSMIRECILKLQNQGRCRKRWLAFSIGSTGPHLPAPTRCLHSQEQELRTFISSPFTRLRMAMAESVAPSRKRRWHRGSDSRRSPH